MKNGELTRLIKKESIWSARPYRIAASAAEMHRQLDKPRLRAHNLKLRTACLVAGDQMEDEWPDIRRGSAN